MDREVGILRINFNIKKRTLSIAHCHKLFNKVKTLKYQKIKSYKYCSSVT